MEKIPTICQQCHIECGVIATVNKGKVVKIEGNPEFPLNKGLLCPKGLNYLELQYHQDRVKFPLKKKNGKWERTTWEEALDIIAERISHISKVYGSKSLALSVGTQPRGNYISTYRLAAALGTPNVTNPGYLCYYPSVTAGTLTFGADVMQERGPDIDHTECILIWGANPLNAHPPIGRKMQQAKRSGQAKMIVVDPRKTKHAEIADYWLQLRPGSDDALALGMINVIINEKLYDHQFVEKWCIGFEQLAERVKEYTPERVSKITWIPPEVIRAVSRLYANAQGAVLYHRVAVEHHSNAIQTLRAFALLIAITGNIDAPGGNVIPHYPSENRQIKKLRQLCPDPIIEIHPDQAKNIGVKENEWVWVEAPGIDHTPEHGMFESNINVILDDEVSCDAICGAVPLRGTLCRLSKAEE